MRMTIFVGMAVNRATLMLMGMSVVMGVALTRAAGGTSKRGGHLAARGAVDTDF